MVGPEGMIKTGSLGQKKNSKKKGYEVIAPAMPEPDYPKIEPWIEKLKEVVGNPKQEQK